MCLILRPASDKRFRAKLGDATWFWAWKWLERRPDGLKSPIYGGVHRWSPGWFKSDRKLAAVHGRDKANGSIHRGLHLCTTRRRARSFSKSLNGSDPTSRWVRVKVYVKDLVAVGWDSELVVMKAFLPKSEYDKAMKG